MSVLVVFAMDGIDSAGHYLDGGIMCLQLKGVSLQMGGYQNITRQVL